MSRQYAVKNTARTRYLSVAYGLLILAALVLMVVGTVPAQAQVGGQFFSLGGAAWARIIGGNTRVLVELSLDSPASMYIGTNLTGPFDPVFLGAFPAGQELVFKAYVPPQTVNGTPAGPWTFYTGPAPRNPDGLAHAKLTYLNPSRAVGIFEFEDWWGGGDRDYNDLVFRVTSQPIPEAGTLGLIGAGLVPAAGILVRRKRFRLV
ncbi:MAG: DUF4114 domain-containing protein [Armatimonadota bacterium]